LRVLPTIVRMALPDEAVSPGHRQAERITHVSRGDRLGGTSGNEILTSATAAVLTLLLLAEGVTVIRMNGLVTVHMFIGMVLIPPVLLKLGSTGYRFARYYTGTRAYVDKGPPYLPLRLLAPVLVVATIALLGTGVVLMADGRWSDTVMFFHKLSFIVWGVVFGIHFLVYVPRVWRSLRMDWKRARRHAVPGSSWRGMLVAASVGGGLALALALLSTMQAFHGGHHAG
jgi:hypothetical protein